MDSHEQTAELQEAEQPTLSQRQSDLITRYAEYFSVGYAHYPEDADSQAFARGFVEDAQAFLDEEQSSEEYTSEAITARILDAVNKTYAHKDPVATLSKAVDTYGLSLRTLRSYNLRAFDEVSLLYAAAYAGASRHTKSGTKLSTDAHRILTHESTNQWVQWDNAPTEVDASEADKMFERYKRATYANLASAQLDVLNALQMPDKAPILSIDAVLPVITKLRYLGGEPTLEDDLRAAAGIEELKLYDEAIEPIKEISADTLRQRLTDISLVEEDLRKKFGDDITIQYKELSIDLDQSTRDLYEPKENDSITENTSEFEAREGSSDFSGYVFIEVTRATGEVFVIADSPDRSNACYVVRSDTMEHMSELIRTPMTWTDVLKYPKETARQLGATRFYHNETVDTLSKAIGHIERPATSILMEVGGKWLTAKRAIYDADMQATTTNRLPLATRELVAKRPEEVKLLLLNWLEIDELPQLARGTKLARRAFEQGPDQPDQEASTESHAAEIEAKDIEILQLRADNDRLRAMLRIAIDGIGK